MTKDLMDKWEGTPYPELIRGLPEADIPFEGVRGWLMQDERALAVFMDIEPIGSVPPHAHGAQWGVLLEGEMELTIGDETKRYQKGDWYYIPAGVTHSATFKTRVQALDIFADVDRYKPK